jgi:hypothetical protein
MDDALAIKLIERDWQAFVEQAARLGLGQPVRDGLRIDLPVTPIGTEEVFWAVLLCDGYDAQAPLLDFADAEKPELLGAAYWPKLSNAPMNAVVVDGRSVPIVCTPGTRGYHLHSSHVNEAYERVTWRLPAVASLLHTFLRKMGPYTGRGL